MAARKILIVEDEFVTAGDLESNLTASGYVVIGLADTGEEAISKAESLQPDLVLMDITLSGEMTGIDAAEKIRARQDIPIVFLTAHSDDATVERVKLTEPFGYILKPYNLRDLKITIEMALYMHAIRSQIKEKEQTIRILVNTVPDALVLLNDQGGIITMNESMHDRLGKDHDDWKGRDIRGFLKETRDQVLSGALDNVTRTGTVVTIEEEWQGKWFETRVYPVRTPHEEISHFVIQSHDITRMKDVEENLRRSGLEQLERDMEQFQILNDQIRNPLQAILLYLEMDDTPHRAKIEQQVKIIDDLVSRLDHGWLESEKVRSFLMKHYQYEMGTQPGVIRDSRR
jgi:PAS domain S-box-containing protein